MDAIRVLDQMLNQGIRPDAIIFHIVLTGCCVREMDPGQIFHVFRWLCSHGLKTNTTTLSIMVKALAKVRAWDEALDLFTYAADCLSIQPELRLYAQLAQACAKENNFKKAVEVYEMMVRFASTTGIAVDETVNS